MKKKIKNIMFISSLAVSSIMAHTPFAQAMDARQELPAGFSWRDYIEINPDVAVHVAGQPNPEQAAIAHYLLEGGRNAGYHFRYVNLPANFKSAEYLQLYPTVALARVGEWSRYTPEAWGKYHFNFHGHSYMNPEDGVIGWFGSFAEKADRLSLRLRAVEAAAAEHARVAAADAERARVGAAEAAEAARARIVAEQAERARLQRVLEAAQAEIAQRNLDIQGLQGQIADLRRQTEAREAQHAAEQQRLRDAQEQAIRALEARHAEVLRGRNEQHDAATEQLRRDQAAEMNRLRAQHQEARERLEAQYRDELRRRDEQAEATRVAHARQIADLNDQIRGLGQANAQAQEAMAQLREVLLGRIAQIGRLNDQVAEQQRAILALQAELHATRAENERAVADLNRRIQEAQGQRDDTQRRLDALHLQNQATEAALRDQRQISERLQGELTATQGTIAQLRREIEGHQATIEGHEATIKERNNQIGQLRAAVDELRTAEAAARRENAANLEKLHLQEQALEELRRKATDLGRENQGLLDRVRTLEARLHELGDLNETLQGRNSRLDKALKLAGKRAEDAIREGEKVQTALERERQETQKIQRANADLRRHIEQVEAELKDAEAELVKCVTRITKGNWEK